MYVCLSSFGRYVHVTCRLLYSTHTCFKPGAERGRGGGTTVFFFGVSGGTLPN